MARYHLFAHNDKNFVQLGDKVIKHVTPIGSIGTGNGQFYAHLHFSISEGLSVKELLQYISGWSKEKVASTYIDPRKIVDFEKMFGKKMDVGNFGYDWLQWVGYGYHPGVDVNGLSGGNSDVGMTFKSSCNGIVIHSNNTLQKNGGWGKIVIVEEIEDKPVEIKEEIMKLDKTLARVAKKYGYDFGDNLSEAEIVRLGQLVQELDSLIDFHGKTVSDLTNSVTTLRGEYEGLKIQLEADKTALNEQMVTLKNQLEEFKKEKVVELSSYPLGDLLSAVFNKFKKNVIMFEGILVKTFGQEVVARIKTYLWTTFWVAVAFGADNMLSSMGQWNLPEINILGSVFPTSVLVGLVINQISKYAHNKRAGRVL